MSNKDKDVSIFREAVKSIIEIMKNASKPTIIYDTIPQINLNKQEWSLKERAKTVYPNVIEFYNEIAHLQSVKKCLDLMIERDFPKYLEMIITDNDGKLVGNPDYKSFLMSEILGNFVNMYLDAYGFEVIEENFKKLYNDMIAYVYSKYREAVIVSPLNNFEMQNLDEFIIDEYKVRKLTEWEMIELIENGYKLGFIFTPTWGSIETMYCVERILQFPKRHTHPLEPYLSDFITLLRLSKSGVVGHYVILHYSKTWRTSWSISGPSQDVPISSPSYILKKSDIQPLTLFWGQFNKVKNYFPNNMKFALRWFNKSYEELETYDKLLDLAIALEVLFGSSSRLDLYVSHFIGLNKDEKIELNRIIVELRKKRGAIVHSGYCSVEHDFVIMLEDIFRRSIQKFISLLNDSSYKEIIRDIKTSILQ